MDCTSSLAALINEAQTYASQGLYHEALDIYGRLLSGAVSLDATQRRDIEAAMGSIQALMDVPQAAENQLLDDPAIRRIKKGWRGAGSPADILVSAGAFRKIGLHGAAFVEYRKLLSKKCVTAEVVEGMADCLVRLVRPEKFFRTIDALANEIFRFSKNILMFKLLIAMHLDAAENPHHFEALYHHLDGLENVPVEIGELIQNLGQTLKDLTAIDSEEDAYGPIAGLDGIYSDWIRND